MRRFLIENRRVITAGIVIILAIFMTRYILINISAPERRIMSDNYKVVFNNKSTYLKNIKIEGITSSKDFSLKYTYIDLNGDTQNEIILEYSGNSITSYYIIAKNNNIYVMKKIPENIDILNMRESKNILSEEGELCAFKYENLEFTKERLAYIDKTSEDYKYIVGEKYVSKWEYDNYIRANYESYAKLQFYEKK